MKVLVVLPEDLHFDTETLASMHYDPATMKEHSRAEAWAVRNTLIEKIAELYFRYFPSPVPSAFFLREEEASVWLDQLQGWQGKPDVPSWATATLIKGGFNEPETFVGVTLKL